MTGEKRGHLHLQPVAYINIIDTVIIFMVINNKNKNHTNLSTTNNGLRFRI